jgi:hypothetical protein
MSLDLPENAGPQRESKILELIKNGSSTINFSTISSQYGNDIATFYIFSDALKIEGVRINVTAETEQKIADMIGCSLLTPKLSDLIFAQAKVVIKPKPRPITSSTAAMIQHSKDTDNEIAKLNVKEGLTATVGKSWLIDDMLVGKPEGTALNYGWHYRGTFAGINGELPVMYKEMPNVRVIQGRGTAHNILHVDYSQTCTLVTRECEVNGKSMDLLDMLKDPKLAYLASHSGALKILRQPGVLNDGVSIVVPDKIGT